MHSRKFIIVACAGLLAASLGACDPKDIANLGAAVNAGTVSPTLSPGQLTAENLAAAGFTAAQTAKILGATQAATDAAKTAGALLCPVLPLAETFANITLAQAATSVPGQTVQATLNFACAKLRRAAVRRAPLSRQAQRRVRT
jgi:hypothetical protein